MKVLLDHLQKTGGTALLDFIRSAAIGRCVSPLILHESIHFAANLLDNFAIVGGHFELRPDYQWNSGIYHVTLLRDPIERFLSHYSYAREQPDAADPFSALARRHDVATLLRLGDPDVLRTARNFYLRHFANAFDAPPPATLAQLFAAIEQRYSLIGVSERMDDVARILCVALGMEPGPVPPVRVTQNRVRQADLDPYTLARLRKLTAADRELHRLAFERFETIARAFGCAPSPTQERTALTRREQNMAVPVRSELPPGAPRVMAAELWCPKSDTNDCALSGAACTLAFEIDPGEQPSVARLDLRITNAFRQVVYRENRPLEYGRGGDGLSLEVLWFFVCHLGAGLYRCSLTLGSCLLEDVYEFSVIQSPRSFWAGLVDLRPSIAVNEQQDMKCDELAGSIIAAKSRLKGTPGALLLLRATIRNEGAAEWRAVGINRVVVTYKLFDEEHTCLVEDGLRTMLPAPVKPGDAGTIKLRVKAPAAPGQYIVRPSFVCERVAWFGEAMPVDLEVVHAIAPHPGALAIA